MKPSDTFFDDGQARRRRLARPISTLLRGLAVAALLPFEWLERLRSGGAVRRRTALSWALSLLVWFCAFEIWSLICGYAAGGPNRTAWILLCGVAALAAAFWSGWLHPWLEAPPALALGGASPNPWSGGPHGAHSGAHGGRFGKGGHGFHGGQRPAWPAWKDQCIHNCPACALPTCVKPGGGKHGRGPQAFAAGFRMEQAQQPAQPTQSDSPAEQVDTCAGDCRTCPNGVCIKTGRLRAVRPKSS